jgi:hypothetical protein
MNTAGPIERARRVFLSRGGYTVSAVLCVLFLGSSAEPNFPFHPALNGWAMHTEITQPNTVFKTGDINLITGNVSTSGGNMTVHNVNGSFPDTILTFGNAKDTIHNQYVSVSGTFGGVVNHGEASFVVAWEASDCAHTGQSSPCSVIIDLQWHSASSPDPARISDWNCEPSCTL